nr:oxalate:formate antiporter [Hymenolepis microstoma]
MKLPIWGVLCVLGGFLYHLALGYFYTVGNMNPYIVSYMGIRPSEAAWFSSTLLALQATFMPIGGILASKIGYKFVLIIAMIFSAGGILLTRLTVDYGLGAYIATYCIMNGIGMGTPYSVIFSIAHSWFPNSRATVVGIISSGFGLGALVFTPIQIAIINPNNLSPNSTGSFPESVRIAIPNAFLIFGGLVFSLELIGTILLREHNAGKSKGDYSLARNTDSTEMKIFAGDVEPKKPVLSTPKSYTVLEALKSIDFYVLFFIVFSDIVPVTLLTSTFKLYGIRSGFDDQFLSAVATTSAAFNCIGRVIWGQMVDRFSSKCPLMCFLVTWATLFLTFPYVTAVGGVASKALYAIWVFLLFFTLSANFVVIPASCTRVFGPVNMATIYGLIYFATCPSALITAGIFSQFDIQGKWIPVYTACGCFCLLSLLMALFIRDKNAHCVGCTNDICAALCDPLRHGTAEEEEA